MFLEFFIMFFDVILIRELTFVSYSKLPNWELTIKYKSVVNLHSLDEFEISDTILQVISYGSRCPIPVLNHLSLLPFLLS